MQNKSFVFGVMLGMMLSVAMLQIKNFDRIHKTNMRSRRLYEETTHLHTSNTSATILVDRDDNTTATQLYEKVRVLCWIVTSPETLKSRAKYVRDSWSKRCNIRLFMSSVEDKDFPAVGLPVTEGRDQLYEKTKEAYKYIWEHYRDKADWFLKADDDTFVVVENLRFLLKDYDPNQPIYFGKRRKVYGNRKFMAGGSGYVLSKEATRRFAEGLKLTCPKGSGVEDWEMGKCMTLMGVEFGDSRDGDSKERFFYITAQEAMLEGELHDVDYYTEHSYYDSCLMREDCFSQYPISFHCGSRPSDMLIYDYLIKAKMYGMGHQYQRYRELSYKPWHKVRRKYLFPSR